MDPGEHLWIPSAYCPMGCGATIHRSPYNGNLICLNPHCPRPNAVIDILGESEQQHLVTFREDGSFYYLRHPIRERLNGLLPECQAAWGLVDLLDAGFDPDPAKVYRLITVKRPHGTDPGEYRLEPKL
jgi:hypothetical protein